MRMVALIDGLKVADNHGFGPVDTIPVTGTIRGTAAEECAVAALARLNKVDMRIGEDPLAGLWSETDKRIVLGEEHKRGHGNAVDDTSAGSAVVVVVCIAEAAIGRNDFFGRIRGWSARGRCRRFDRCPEKAQPCGGSAASVHAENDVRR